MARKTDDEITAIYRRAINKRTDYRAVWRTWRLFLFLVFTPGLIVGLYAAGVSFSNAMIIGGASLIVVGLSWNAVWVNTVAYKITREEVENAG